MRGRVVLQRAEHARKVMRMIVPEEIDDFFVK